MTDNDLMHSVIQTFGHPSSKYLLLKIVKGVEDELKSHNWKNEKILVNIFSQIISFELCSSRVKK